KAVPSLFTGLEVRHSEPVSDRGLRLTFADGRAALWDEVPNWFRHVKAKGLGVAAAGFYHPYCRALPDSFDDCYWEPYAVLPAMVWSNYTEPMGPRSFFYHTLRELRFHPMLHPLLLDTMRRVSLDPEENEIIARQSGQLSRLLVQAQRMVTDPNLGVVYVHLPVPHAYGIWNGREQRTARAREGSYVENLQLADRVLGEFRDFLERNGIWDEATVLVTSDHALRTEYWNSNLAGFVPDTPLLKKPPRIPFLFKLPRQPGGLVYQRPFTAKVSAGLMQAALEGRVQSYQDAARWLDSSEFWKPAFEHFPEIGRRNAHADVKRPE
ncbi:MAG TPA: hypothetical protein DEH78_06575, partial [Solibacterales bacterium]|nr:hypothetical protein [Bryobacterales bacterium]